MLLVDNEQRLSRPKMSLFIPSFTFPVGDRSLLQISGLESLSDFDSIVPGMPWEEFSSLSLNIHVKTA